MSDYNHLSNQENLVDQNTNTEKKLFEIKVNVKKMLFFLNHQSAFLTKNAISPVLLNCYIETINENCCKMIVTDLSSSIIQEVDYNVQHKGKLTFPSKILCDILKRLNADDEIIIRRVDSKLLILSNSSKYELPIIDYNTFPFPAKNTKLEDLKEISREQLLAIIDKTFLFICTSETKYILNSVYFHTVYKNEEKYLRAVTTDGCRLAVSEFKCLFDIKANVSRKTIIELKSLLIDSKSEIIKFAFTENECLFVVDHTAIRSKLSVGNFPDYTAVMPKNNNEYIQLKTEDLKNVLLRVSVVVPEKTVIINFTKNQALEITSKDQDILAQGSLTIFDSKINIDSFQVAFNAQYILDIISVKNNSEFTVFYFNTENIYGPSIVKQDDTVDYILMPMRA